MAEEFDPKTIENNLARAQAMAKKQRNKRTAIITGGLVFLCIALVGSSAGIYSWIISSQPTMPPPPANLYDSFDAPTGTAFDSNLWQSWGDNPAEYLNENGTLSQATSSNYAGLFATGYTQFKINQPFVYEAKMMLDNEFHAGAVDMGLHTSFDDGSWWGSGCSISAAKTDTQGYASCSETGDFSTDIVSVPFGTWHTFRVEVDPSSMIFTYYLDGILLGSHTPNRAEALKNVSFDFVIQTYGASPKIKAYFDDIIIGPK